jgi:hypothetical protein
MAISDTQLTSTLANLFAIFLDCTAKFFPVVQRPPLIFEKALANIANCISGLTVLAIKRNR